MIVRESIRKNMPVRLELTGLKRRTDLNGKIGDAVGTVGADGKIAVQLEKGTRVLVHCGNVDLPSDVLDLPSCKLVGTGMHVQDPHGLIWPLTQLPSHFANPGDQISIRGATVVSTPNYRRLVRLISASCQLTRKATEEEADAAIKLFAPTVSLAELECCTSPISPGYIFFVKDRIVALPHKAVAVGPNGLICLA